MKNLCDTGVKFCMSPTCAAPAGENKAMCSRHRLCSMSDCSKRARYGGKCSRHMNNRPLITCNKKKDLSGKYRAICQAASCSKQVWRGRATCYRHGGTRVIKEHKVVFASKRQTIVERKTSCSSIERQRETDRIKMTDRMKQSIYLNRAAATCARACALTQVDQASKERRVEQTCTSDVDSMVKKHIELKQTHARNFWDLEFICLLYHVCPLFRCVELKTT